MNPDARRLIWVPFRNSGCTECELHKSAQSVCLMGDGPVPCDVMIVGEAPGYREDEIKRPFSGRSGQLLDEVMRQHAGLEREDVYVTNVVKCRPPDNSTPTRGQIKTCRHYLDDEIDTVKPKFILLVGNSALSVIKKSGITKHRGEVFQYGEASVLPTVHPAAVLRNPRYDRIFRTDLAAFGRLVRSEPSAPAPRTFLVQGSKSLRALIRAILAAPAVAYDLETSSFEDFREDSRIATVGVAVKPGLAFVVPIHHPEARWKDPERVLRLVGNALAYTNARLVAHNGKFDDRWMNSFGQPVYTDFDTLIAAHMLDENQFKGLKPLAQMILGVDAWAVDSSKVMFMPLKKVARYNAKDADYTLRLYYKFRHELKKPELSRTARIFLKLLMPASKCLTDIERYGLWLDDERLAARRIEINEHLVQVNRKLSKAFGMEANWNSPKVLGQLLFEQLELPVIERTPKGAASTKESVLLQLKHKHPVAELIMEWRKWFKYNSTYFDSWEEARGPDGRMHPNYKITGTVTGRLSSGKEEGSRNRGLNAQQVPRDSFIRGVIGAPAGWRFVEADFSQVELRIAAHIARDQTMLRLFQMGVDIHLQTAVYMTKKAPKDISKEERKKAKSVNFGYIFGMGVKKFVVYARDNYDLIVTMEEAQEFRDNFFREYSALTAWHARQRRLAKNYGWVQSPIGRIRHLPDINSEDKEVRAEAERQAINSPVQSMASDMMLLSMVLLHPQMPPDEAKIVGTVHDSLLFEIREDLVDEWVPIIKHTMENLPLKKKFGLQLTVPIVADVTVGQHWSEGEPWAA